MRARLQKLLLLSLLSGVCLFQGCPVSALSDCFAEGSISRSAYDDLNDLEQALYEENSCGRYEPRSGFAEDILDIF